jgi:hypothetical protein
VSANPSKPRTNEKTDVEALTKRSYSLAGFDTRELAVERAEAARRTIEKGWEND